MRSDQHIAVGVHSKWTPVVILRLDRRIYLFSLNCPIKSGNDDEPTRVLCNVKVYSSFLFFLNSASPFLFFIFILSFHLPAFLLIR